MFPAVVKKVDDTSIMIARASIPERTLLANAATIGNNK